MTDPVTVSYTRNERIANIRLDRPDKMNALSIEMMEQLQNIIQNISANKNIRVVTIRGAGGNFSAGADLENLESSIDSGDRQAVDDFLVQVQQTLIGITDLHIPVIAIVEGFAIAGGLELLLACDLTISSNEAIIGDQHANYGLIGGGGSTQRLARKVGVSKAKELILTGKRISGKEAYDNGLINRVSPQNELDVSSQEFVEEIADKGRETTITANHLINLSESTPLETGLEIERELVKSHLFSEEASKGLTAFNAGREPEFK